MGWWPFGRKRQRAQTLQPDTAGEQRARQVTANTTRALDEAHIHPALRGTPRGQSDSRGGMAAQPYSDKEREVFATPPQSPSGLRRGSAEDITALPTVMEGSPHLRPVPDSDVKTGSAARAKRPAADEATRGRAGRKKDEFQKRVDAYLRQEEVRAMTAPIEVPKRPQSGTEGLSKREGKKSKAVGPGMHKADSSVSLPAGQSVRSSITGVSEHRTFEIGSMGLFSARPTIRHSLTLQPTQLPIQSEIPSRTASVREKEKNREDQKAGRRRRKDGETIDELANDLSPASLRELMERDKRRQEKKRKSEEERARRRLERHAAKAEAAEASRKPRTRRRREEAEAAAPVPTLPADEAGPSTLGGDVGARAEPAVAIERELEIPPKSEARRPAEPVRAEELSAREIEAQERLEPVSQPTEATTEPPKFEDVAAVPAALQQDRTKPPEEALPLAAVEEARPVDTVEEARPVDTVEEARPVDTVEEPGVGPEEDADEELVTPLEEPVTATAQAIRYSLASISPTTSATQQLQEVSRVSETPEPDSSTAPAAAATEREPETAPVADDRRFSDSSTGRAGGFTALFRRIGTRKGGSERGKKSEQSFSNTKRTLPYQAPDPEWREAFLERKRSSGVPSRTKSRFREDLPETPTSTGSPHDGASEAAPLEDTLTAAEVESGPAEQVEEAALPESLGSVDAEGSWLTGKPRKRTSQQMSIARSSTSKYTSGLTSSNDDSPASDEPRTSHSLDTTSASQPIPEVPAKSAERKMRLPFGQGDDDENVVHGEVSRSPTIVHQQLRVKSNEGLLNLVSAANTGESNSDEADASQSADLPEVKRATSVRQHVRAVSGGSAKLLEIPSRGHSNRGSRELSSTPEPPPEEE